MILFVDENLPDLLRERVFAEPFALTDAIPIVTYGLVFVVQVIPKHLFRLVRGSDRLRCYGRHLAEIIDLTGKHERVLELFMSMGFELIGDAHIFGAFSTCE